MTRRFSAYAFACVAVLALAACGDDDDDGSFRGLEDLSSGSITNLGIGTMDVNGVSFNTAASTVKFREEFVSGDFLREGMVVAVRGRIDGEFGSAPLIVATDVIEGPVEQVLDANVLVVLGQTVLVPDSSSFSGGVPPAVGAIVRVYGFVKNEGIVKATLVEQTSFSTQFRVDGLIENTDTIALTFTIGQLTVDYGTRVADTSDLPGGVPADGLFVQVVGDLVPITSNTLLGPAGELIATRVSLEKLPVTQADRAEVQGFVIDDSLAPAEFVLNNQQVQTTADTVFLGGTAGEIDRGSELEADGVLNGTLVASQIVFRDDIVLESNARSVLLSPTRIELEGLPGISLRANSTTELSGNVLVGRHIRGRGREIENIDNAVLATRLTLTDPQSTVVLQGRVDGVSENRFINILGVSVDTSDVADDRFRGVRDETIGRTAFFAGVQVGDLVRASGKLNGAAVSWEELKREE